MVGPTRVTVAVPVISLLLLVCPSHATAQSTTGHLEHLRELTLQQDEHVQRLRLICRQIRFESGTVTDAGTHSVGLVVWPDIMSGITVPAALITYSAEQTGTSPAERRGWVGRHPVIFGTLVGFGTGFLVGYLPGDDGVFYDFTAEFNGLVIGTIGAGVGALVGGIIGEVTK